MESKETKDTEEILDEVCALFEEKYKTSDALSNLRRSGKKISSRVEIEAKDFIEQVLKEKEGCTGEEVRLVSGMKFPDITLFGTQGIEVKTSQQGWKIPGNSVQEGTRIQGVEVVFILFLNCAGDTVECRYGRYDKYVAGFVVTHNPRYQIDMELEKGDSVFEKMDMTYSDFSNHPEPRRLVVDYYIQNSEPGERPWFSHDPEFVSPPTTKSWALLSTECQEELKAEMYARFPEVIGSSRDKYLGVAIWLIKQHGIFNPSLRDLFSAGGIENVTISGQMFPDVPRVFLNLNNRMKDIIGFLQSDQEECDPVSWSYRFEEGDSPIAVWKEIVVQQCEEKQRELLKAIINSHCA